SPVTPAVQPAAPPPPPIAPPPIAPVPRVAPPPIQPVAAPPAPVASPVVPAAAPAIPSAPAPVAPVQPVATPPPPVAVPPAAPSTAPSPAAAGARSATPAPGSNGDAMTLEKLIEIVRAGAKELECEIDDDATELIARSANGIPTNALIRLRRILEYDRSGTLAPALNADSVRKGLKIFFPEPPDSTKKA